MKFLVMLIVLGAVESVPVVRRLDEAQEAAAAECGDCEVTAAEAELLRRDRTVYSAGAGEGGGEGWGEVVIDREFLRGADNRLVVLVRMVIETGTSDMEEESWEEEEEETSSTQLLS